MPNAKSVEEIKEIAQGLVDQSDKEPQDTQLLLTSVAYTLGALLTKFPPEDRGKIIMGLTEDMAQGMMEASKKIGEPFKFTVFVGGREGLH